MIENLYDLSMLVEILLYSEVKIGYIFSSRTERRTQESIKRSKILISQNIASEFRIVKYIDKTFKTSTFPYNPLHIEAAIISSNI